MLFCVSVAMPVDELFIHIVPVPAYITMLPMFQDFTQSDRCVFHHGQRRFPRLAIPSLPSVLRLCSSGRELRSHLNLTGLPLSRTDKLEGKWELHVPGYEHPIQLAGDIYRDPEATAPSQYKVRRGRAVVWCSVVRN